MDNGDLAARISWEELMRAIASDMAIFGRVIKAKRETLPPLPTKKNQKHMGLRDLADALGIDYVVLSRVEQGRWMPDETLLQQLLDWLFPPWWHLRGLACAQPHPGGHPMASKTQPKIEPEGATATSEPVEATPADAAPSDDPATVVEGAATSDYPYIRAYAQFTGNDEVAMVEEAIADEAPADAVFKKSTGWVTYDALHFDFQVQLGRLAH